MTPVYRQRFWVAYNSASKLMARWLEFLRVRKGTSIKSLSCLLCPICLSRV